VTLPAGSRVVDALQAAGGSRKGTDLASLNLARPLADGEQILVGTGVPAAPSVAGTPGAPTADGSAAGGALVNLNTATSAELEELPGIGPVTAASILQWRTEHGRFTSVEELLEVSGIGEARLADVRDLVTV
jgi:competence protein ComEA